MVYIPEGEFIMGSEEGDSDEQSVHTVYLDAFYIDKTEVTNAQFAQFLNEQGNQEEGGAIWLDIGSEHCLITQTGEQYQPRSGYENHPVIEVSWYGARAYCQWAGKRLPTEAEWEKAARGTDGRTYPWGEGIDCDRAQYFGCEGRTVPVGSKPKGRSPYGALDMAGNVWEWTASLWGEDLSEPEFKYPYYPDDGREDLHAPTAVLRVFRGGSWKRTRSLARCAYRHRGGPGLRIDDVGFRCAWSSP
jgi:formylglycine-generating enzyme required for sulfatase activity